MLKSYVSVALLFLINLPSWDTPRRTADDILSIVLDRAHPCDGSDLLRVGFDAMLEDDEPKQHAPRDPEDAFFRVEFDVVCS